MHFTLLHYIPGLACPTKTSYPLYVVPIEKSSPRTSTFRAVQSTLASLLFTETSYIHIYLLHQPIATKRNSKGALIPRQSRVVCNINLEELKEVHYDDDVSFRLKRNKWSSHKWLSSPYIEGIIVIKGSDPLLLESNSITQPLNNLGMPSSSLSSNLSLPLSRTKSSSLNRKGSKVYASRLGRQSSKKNGSIKKERAKKSVRILVQRENQQIPVRPSSMSEVEIIVEDLIESRFEDISPCKNNYDLDWVITAFQKTI